MDDINQEIDRLSGLATELRTEAERWKGDGAGRDQKLLAAAWVLSERAAELCDQIGRPRLALRSVYSIMS